MTRGEMCDLRPILNPITNTAPQNIYIKLYVLDVPLEGEISIELYKKFLDVLMD